VTPVIQQRWPNYQDSIATVCDIQSETQQLLDDLAALDYEGLSDASDISPTAKLPSTLSVNGLTLLSLARKKNVIRYWLRISQRSGLPKARLDTFTQQLGAKQSANPVIVNGSYDIRIYDGRVFIVDQDRLKFKPVQSVYDFLTQPVLDIPELNLVLRRSSVLGYLGLEESGQVIQIRFRTNELIINQHNHRLKRLFQSHKIAPWLRSTTPQLLIDGKLMGIWAT
jgi:tRNA(Ile)-lysidine synthase